MKNLHISGLVILGIMLILVCARLPQQPDEDNPMDRSNPDYIPPQVQINTDVPDTINSDSITISWTGNEYIQKTCYYLAGYNSGWSAWDTTGNHLYTYLDEKSYCFYVKGIYANGDSAIDSIKFAVNAITGPAVILYPQLSYSSTDNAVEIQVLLEDVTDFIAGKIVLSFPKQSLTVANIQKGILYTSNNYNDITIMSYSDSSITIETGVSGGTNSGFSGTGVLLRLEINNTRLDNNLLINQESTVLKNTSQQDIILNKTRGAFLK